MSDTMLRKFLVLSLFDDGIAGMKIFYGKNVRDMIARQYKIEEDFFDIHEDILEDHVSPDFDGWKSVDQFVNAAYDFISDSRIDGDSQAQITIIDITGDLPILEV